MNHQTTARGSILGVVAAVPDRIITNADCPDPAAADEAATLTGVYERRWVKPGQTSRTLCTDAAKRLMAGLGWTVDDVDLIVYVTQTPESAVPADVFRIASDIGAPRAICLQANYSCSGYVYGLWLAMRMLEGMGKRALLLVGDATSTIADPADRATAPLFGDAGSATAILGNSGEHPVDQHFVLGADGGGVDKLCTRHSTAFSQEPDGGYLHMDGAAVFNFTLKRVPALVSDVRALMQLMPDPDYWLLHQANRFMLGHLAKKSDLHALKVPINIERFGNTSCASIPLLMSGLCLDKRAHTLAMLGYGAGWAYAGAAIKCEPLKVCELIECAT